jgi:hypothetical protein
MKYHDTGIPYRTQRWVFHESQRTILFTKAQSYESQGIANQNLTKSDAFNLT